MKTPVDELEGRELDAAVAEEVMGYETRRMGELQRIKEDSWSFTHPPTEDDPIGRVNSGEFWSACPYYSTDIAAAWKVVGEVGGGITVWHGADKFRVCWTDNYSSALEVCQHTRPDMTADTAPEAICRAALKAVRSKDE